jgi:hypothetical protein
MQIVRTILQSLMGMSFYGKWRMIWLSGFWRTFGDLRVVFCGNFHQGWDTSDFVWKYVKFVEVSKPRDNEALSRILWWIFLDEQIIDKDLDWTQPCHKIVTEGIRCSLMVPNLPKLILIKIQINCRIQLKNEFQSLHWIRGSTVLSPNIEVSSPGLNRNSKVYKHCIRL